jgi:hypothetical protein
MTGLTFSSQKAVLNIAGLTATQLSTLSNQFQFWAESLSEIGIWAVVRVGGNITQNIAIDPATCSFASPVALSANKQGNSFTLGLTNATNIVAMGATNLVIVHIPNFAGDFQLSGDFATSKVQLIMERILNLAFGINQKTQQALAFANYDIVNGYAIPNPTARAGKAIAFDANGNPIVQDIP